MGSAVAILALIAPAAAVLFSPAAAYGQTNATVPCSGTGGGSDGLIAAISAANSGGGGTITLAAGCTYSLTASNNGTNGAPMSGASGENGLPVVTSAITVTGSSTTIAANNTTFRIFQVAGGGNLTLQGLTLTGGNSPFGGAILNVESTVTLDNTMVTGNSAGLGGGGIASGVLNPNKLGPSGSLTLNNSEVNGNKQTGAGGSPGMSGGGGGILNHAGSLTLNGSQVNSNTSSGGGGGLASGTGNGGAAGAAVLTIDNSEVNNNVSNGGPMAGGGGIANGSMAQISGSQVDGNSAPGSFGGGIINHGTMTIQSSQINGNSAPVDGSGNPGFGGGIASLDLGPAVGAPNGGVLNISSTQIEGNSAAVGPAIVEQGINAGGDFLPGGPLSITDGQISGNTGAATGAIVANVGSEMSFTSVAFGSNPFTSCSGRTGNDAWLCAVYVDVLGRAPDSSGSAHFEGLLAHGTSRTQVADDILTSTEYWKGFVSYFYSSLLGRPVDATGEANWVGQLNHGASDVSVIVGVLSSPEFYKKAGATSAGYVSALYTDLFGRSPSSADMSFWSSKLSSGSSRATVASDFVTSREYVISALQTNYLGALDRAGSSSELSHWYSVLFSGTPFEMIEAGIYGSTEFYNKWG